MYSRNVTDKYIQVPCGICAECLQRKQAQMVQRSINQFIGFHCLMLTLTYKDEMLPHFYLDRIDESTGNVFTESFPYPAVSDIQNMFKRIRKYQLFDYLGKRDFKYLFATEYGGKKHRPHFHILLFLQSLPSDLIGGRVNPYFTYQLEQYIAKCIKKQWSRNVGTNRKPIYKPLCDYVTKGNKSTFQCEYVRNKNLSIFDLNDDIKDGMHNVAFYVSKYTLKFDKFQNYLWNKLKITYDHSEKDDISLFSQYPDKIKDGRLPFTFYWNLLRPKCIASKFFGLSSPEQKEYIQKNISNSLYSGEPFPKYKNLLSGDTFGLCSYFLHRCVDNETYKQFFKNLDSDLKKTDYDISRFEDDSKISSEESRSFQNNSKIDKYNRICHILENKNSENFL